jgi:putative methyltransferase (TIGR04325 family)
MVIVSEEKPFKIWEGVFSSFAETGADNSAFQGHVWTKKLTERAARAKALSGGAAAVARVTETRDYALPFIAATMARRDAALRILDFGGGVATSFFPLVQMLSADQPLVFVVVENETVCELGRTLLLGEARVRFESQMPADERFDIVHCGSSIEYIDDWTGMLGRLSEYRPTYLIFVNLPAADNKTFVSTQYYYGSRIPMRFWNFHDFVLQVEKLRYELVLKSQFRGYWRDTYPEMPTDNFSFEYRARYFSQLVFRRLGNVDR